MFLFFAGLPKSTIITIIITIVFMIITLVVIIMCIYRRLVQGRKRIINTYPEALFTVNDNDEENDEIVFYNTN
jgi:uncharacterized BrkB/YihY/UPF0761 family membrane protein